MAIKVLHDTSASARERLLVEARSASGLNHPNISTIHEVGDVDGMPFIAMELVSGQSLRSLITASGLPADVVTRLAPHTGLGDRDQAFAWLRRARIERAWGMAFVNVEAHFDSLRSDPRFAAIAGR